MTRRRSRFEEAFEADLKARKVKYEYEATTFSYTVPKTYTPDFKIGNIYIETKGYHKGIQVYLQQFVHFRRQNPELDVRFVFDRGIANKKLGVKMTYADWANKNNIKWAEETIPDEWLKEANGKVKRAKIHKDR